jgi:hypothetical protein
VRWGGIHSAQELPNVEPGSSQPWTRPPRVRGQVRQAVPVTFGALGGWLRRLQEPSSARAEGGQVQARSKASGRPCRIAGTLLAQLSRGQTPSDVAVVVPLRNRATALVWTGRRRSMVRRHEAKARANGGRLHGPPLETVPAGRPKNGRGPLVAARGEAKHAARRVGPRCAADGQRRTSMLRPLILTAAWTRRGGTYLFGRNPSSQPARTNGTTEVAWEQVAFAHALLAATVPPGFRLSRESLLTARRQPSVSSEPSAARRPPEPYVRRAGQVCGGVRP